MSGNPVRSCKHKEMCRLCCSDCRAAPERSRGHMPASSAAHRPGWLLWRSCPARASPAPSQLLLCRPDAQQQMCQAADSHRHRWPISQMEAVGQISSRTSPGGQLLKSQRCPLPMVRLEFIRLLFASFKVRKPRVLPQTGCSEVGHLQHVAPRLHMRTRHAIVSCIQDNKCHSCTSHTSVVPACRALVQAGCSPSLRCGCPRR